MPKTLTDETYEKIDRALIYAREHVPLPDIDNLFDSPDADDMIDACKKAIYLLEGYKQFTDDSSALKIDPVVVLPEVDAIAISVRSSGATVKLADLFEAPEAFPNLGNRSSNIDSHEQD